MSFHPRAGATIESAMNRPTTLRAVRAPLWAAAVLAGYLYTAVGAD